MRRAALFFAVLLAACASAQPAPIVYGRASDASHGPRPPPRIETAPQRQSEAPPMTTPAPDWAEGEGTPLSSYALQAQDAHPYDPARPPRTHRVGADESLYDIAVAHQIPLRALIEQNRLEPPYALTPGQVLELPPPRLHVAARGESFEQIARRYDIDPRSLALLNRMQPPYAVRAGQRILLPAVAQDNAPAALIQSPSVSASEHAAAAPGEAMFAWPLRGEIIARFGAQPGGRRLDGLEIAGREGALVAAADDGEVVYAGTDLPAYGALVLVRHAGDYVTAYAYNRRTLVREGQQVRRGDPLAELGPRAEGGARLLFQVRRGGEAIDPAPLLGVDG